MTGPSPRLRAVTFATALAGITTMVAAGVVTPLIGLGAALLVACTTMLSIRLVGPGAPENRRRAAVVVLGIAAVVAVVANGGTLTDSTGSVLGVLLCAAVTAHSLVLDTVRDLRVNIAISLSMLLLAAGLAPGLSIAVPVVVTWGCAIAALVLASAEGQGSDLAVRAVVTTDGPAPERGTATTIATVVSVAVLVGLALALVLPHPPGVSAHSSFGAAGAASRSPSGSTPRTATAYLGDGPLNLDNRGHLGTAPIAVVTGGANTLWRAAVLESYDGHGWWPGIVGATETLGAGSTTVAVPKDPLSPAQPHPSTQRDGVGWLSSAAPVVISPGLVTSVALRQPGAVVRESDGRLTLTSESATPTYAVTSTVVPDVSTVVGPEVGRDAQSPAWLGLPGSLPPRVGELANRITAGTTDRASAVRAVSAYLREHQTYDLDSPVAPADGDSVDDFLFNSRSGFCEHFASAEVVLLRSVGIPSRVVTGFLSGNKDADGRTVLITSESHAWVEVWIRGTGWVSSDPTAGATLAKHSSGGITGVLQHLLDAVTGSVARKIVLAVALVLIAVVALLLPGLRRRRRVTSEATHVPTTPLFAAFHRFEEALERAGTPRAPAESVRALTSRLQADGTTGDEVVGALLTVERASYASVPPTRDQTRDATEAIDRAAARLLTETGRKD